MRATHAVCLTLVVAACGPSATQRPARPFAHYTLPTLEGTWADTSYSLTFHGHDYRLRDRVQSILRRGRWSHDGPALHLVSTYDLSVEDRGNTLVLTPVGVSDDHDPTLRLRRLTLPPLAGTTWTDAADATLAFTAHGFVRDRLCPADCPTESLRTEGTWVLSDGELTLATRTARETYGVLFDHGDLLLINKRAIDRYRPAR
jgi:hypothetical protein